MATPENNLERLEKLLGLLNDGVSKEDFVQNFEKVLEIVKRALEISRTEFELIQENFNLLSKKLEGSNSETLESVKGDASKAVEQLTALVKEKIDSVRDGKDSTVPGPSGPKGEKGDPGQDAEPIDLEEIIKEVLARVPKDGPVARLIGGSRQIAVQGLGVMIDKNVRYINFKGSGLTSVIRNSSGIVDVTIGGSSGGGTLVSEEVPTDSGDHLSFTIAHTPISGTFRLYRGGARQQSIGATPDFSRVGTALTLITALDTANGEVLMCDYEY